MSTMRAVDIKNGTGDADSLYFNDIPKPKPSESQALVKVKAFGLNRMDLLQREGNYPVPPQASKILGVEFSGVIESFGKDPEKGFNVGDEVFGLAYGGAYAEYIAVSTHMLVHKPKELSWEECAGIPETWITATQAMYLIGQYKPGDSILWHAGASSVSLSGIQLAHADSPKGVYATTRSDEKNDFLTSQMGVNVAFNSKTSKSWADEVLAATNGRGVDIIVDFIGADTFAENIKAIARDGRIVLLGFLSGTKLPAGVDVGPFIIKRIRYEGSSLRSRDEEYQGRLRDQLVEHALPKFKDGSFKVHVEKVFEWEKITEAHKLMESNQTRGKIICTIS